MKRSLKYIILGMLLFAFFSEITYSNWYNNHHRTVSNNPGPNLTPCDDDNDGISDPVAAANNNSSTTLVPETNLTSVSGRTSIRCLHWDSQDPTATLNSNSEPWTSSNINLQMIGTDIGGSGVNGSSRRWCETQSAAGCTAFNRSDSNFWIVQEGEHYISMYLEDVAGNTSSRTFGPFQIDKTPPSRPTISSPSHPSRVWTPNRTINMRVERNNEGPSPSYSLRCLDQNNTCTPFEAMQNPDTTDVFIPDDGQRFFRAMTWDTGGWSPIDSYEVWTDTTPLVVTIGNPGQTFTTPPPPTSPVPTGTSGWTNDINDVTIELDAYDPNDPSGTNSGFNFARTRRSVVTDGALTACVTGTDIASNDDTVIPSQGEYYHAFCLEDVSGNIFEAFSGLFQYDNTVPSTPDVTSSHTRDSWNTTSNVSFNIAETNLFSYGNTSGSVGPSPYESRYCIQKNSPCSDAQVDAGTVGNSYSANLTDGTRYFSARTIETDFGNAHKSPVNTYMFRIDTQMPDVDANPPSRLNWSNVTTLNIALTAFDVDKDGSQSGRATASYVVNQNATHNFGGTCAGGNLNSGSFTHADFAEGTNYIHMCIIDTAGNQYTETFGFYLVDLTVPAITDDYGTNNGVWQNSNQTINLTATDAHSGINIIRYCYGAGCNPATGTNLVGPNVIGVGTNSVTRALPVFLSNPPTNRIVRYQAVDYAGWPSAIQEVDVRTESIPPTQTSPLSFHNGRDNGDALSAGKRRINFAVSDSGGSELERVLIEVRRATTNNSGGRSAFGGWTTAPGGDFTGLSGNNYVSSYTFPFENGVAAQFRVSYWDEAGNTGTILTSASTLWMDNVPPTVSDNHPAARDGVWQNTPVTVTFSWDDQHSGVSATGFRYCTGAGCDPAGGLSLSPSTRTFTADQDTIFRYGATDRAGSYSSNTGQIHIQIEDNAPTATLSYFNGRDNSGRHGTTPGQSVANRTVTYSASDTGGSGLENVILQVQESDTNNAGGLQNNWTAWTDVAGHTLTGLDTDNTGTRTYTQPFRNGKAVRFRLVVNDEATNTINALGYIDSTNIIRMDNVDPTVDDGYANDNVRVNTTQTVNFTLLDDDSGIPNTLAGRRYCLGTLGSDCTPNVLIPGTPLNFPPDSEFQLRYNATDRASNLSVPQFGSINILVEDKAPTGTISYLDGWDNSPTGDGNTSANSIANRTISYGATDSAGGAINSNLRTVILQRGFCNTPSGACTPTTWTDVVTHDINQQSLLNQSYVQPFENERSYMYRLYIEDWAGNIVTGGHATSTSILRMDDVDPTAALGYSGVNGTRYNTTQTINYSLNDNYSGTNQQRYCETNITGFCNPMGAAGIDITGGTLTYPPDTELRHYYQADDNAGNISNDPALEILIEDNLPTGTLTYLDGWDNNGNHNSNATNSITNRTINYTAQDVTDTINSGIRNITLQRGECPLTGACGSPTNWTDVEVHTDIAGNLSNIDSTNAPYTYVEPFLNERSYIYRLYIEDWAGNVVSGGHVTSTDILRLDDEDPTIDDDYANHDVWMNTPQQVNFTNITDNYSGIEQRRYCRVNYGSAPCDPYGPGLPIPASNRLNYPVDSYFHVYYSSSDIAQNFTTNRGQGEATKQYNILIEDDHATGVIDYQHIWTNGVDPTERQISFWARDDAPAELMQSNIQILRLEKRSTSISADDGSVDTFGNTWTTVSGHDYDYSTGTPMRSLVNDVRDFMGANGYAYEEPFVNRTAHQYRIFVQDVAGNQKWIYYTTAGSQAVIDTVGLPAAPLVTLRMEDEESDASFAYLDTNLSVNGWTNVTNQSIRIDFTDTGGSLLSNYVLQRSVATDNPTFSSLGTTWTTVQSGPISGQNGSATYSFTGLNNHAYDFRVQAIDNAGNGTPWIQSTQTPIKIDIVPPTAADIIDLNTVTELLATQVQAFDFRANRNGGAPITLVLGEFENENTPTATISVDSTADNTPAIAGELNEEHSIQYVDNDIVAGQGHRIYTYDITSIVDEAGNSITVSGGNVTTIGQNGSSSSVSGTTVRGFDYEVYANTQTMNTGANTKLVTATSRNSIEDTDNIADGTTATVTINLQDIYGNDIVPAPNIGREVNFGITHIYNLPFDQYSTGSTQAIFMRTSQTGGFKNISSVIPTDLENLTNTPGTGEYNFDYQIFAPTASWYPSAESVSYPGSGYNIESLSLYVTHNGTIDPTWSFTPVLVDNSLDINFIYGPLYTTTIAGDIDTFGIAGEGTRQNSTITVQKSASSVNPNSDPQLMIEFGEGDRQSSNQYMLQYFDPTANNIGEGAGNATVYSTFDRTNPSMSPTFISMLTQDTTAPVSTRQNSYFSTHVSYSINQGAVPYTVHYNTDIVGKDNYHGSTGIIYNTIQGGIKVLGQTHSSRQKDIVIDQAQDDIQLLGKIYKASLKKNIVKNAFTIIRNPDSSWTYGGSNPVIGDLSDFSSSINTGESIFNDSVLYFGDDGTNALVTINPTSVSNAAISGKKTILAYGRDVYIAGDMYYADRENDILGIIALSDENGNGGNIYINPNVTNIVGTLFAEKSLVSFDGTNELGGGVDQYILRHQLHIFGSVFSENTIGGSRNNPLLCPYYVNNPDYADPDQCDATVNPSTAQAFAQRYDMNYLRRYYTYINGAGVRLPANNAKVIGGGRCDGQPTPASGNGDGAGGCEGGNTNFARNITDSSEGAAPLKTVTSTDNTYANYPVVIEYNSSAQTNPAPLFEAE